MLRLLVAFLLSTHYLQLLIDGQRTLHAAILERLAWFGSKRILLDWFHLKEKCAKELSTLCRGSRIRNAVLSRLLTLLWCGRVDAAIAYLRALDPEKIKPGQSVGTLIGYFERNRDYIPCYALRKPLGLRNSSNRGEKANDLCVAKTTAKTSGHELVEGGVGGSCECGHGIAQPATDTVEQDPSSELPMGSLTPLL